MDPSLKQRLLGAAVLVALAIIFVPMLLSGPDPTRQAQSVDVPIPAAPEPEFERRSLAVQLPEPRPTAAQPTDANVLPTVDTATAPPPAVRPAPVEDDAGESTTAQEPPPVKASPSPTPAPVVQSPTTATANVGTAANLSYYIPAGVYARAGNADDLVARLKKAGYPASSVATQWQGKAARRVSVGPFDTRAAAEAARLKLKDGERGLAVGNVQQQAADAAGDATEATLPADRAGGWAVQLGAFGSRADADKLRDRAVAAGFPAFVDQVNADGKFLWRVRVGPHAERALADSARAAVRDKLKIDGLVVNQP